MKDDCFKKRQMSKEVSTSTCSTEAGQHAKGNIWWSRGMSAVTFPIASGVESFVSLLLQPYKLILMILVNWCAGERVSMTRLKWVLSLEVVVADEIPRGLVPKL